VLIKAPFAWRGVTVGRRDRGRGGCTWSSRSTDRFEGPRRSKRRGRAPTSSNSPRSRTRSVMASTSLRTPPMTCCRRRGAPIRGDGRALGREDRAYLRGLRRVAFAIGLTWTESAAARGIARPNAASLPPAGPDANRWLPPARRRGLRIHLLRHGRGRTNGAARPSLLRGVRGVERVAHDSCIQDGRRRRTHPRLLHDSRLDLAPALRVWASMEGGLPEFTKVGIL